MYNFGKGSAAPERLKPPLQNAQNNVQRNINVSCKPQFRKTEGQKHLDFDLPLK
jgi:hypothetical protein